MELKREYLNTGLLSEVENSACEVLGTIAAPAVQVCVAHPGVLSICATRRGAPEVGLVQSTLAGTHPGRACIRHLPSLSDSRTNGC